MTVDAAVELWRAARAAEGARPSAEALRQAAGRLEGALLVVREEGFAAGRVEGEALELLEVVVLPAVRRRGHGSALADALADEAWALGARQVAAAGGCAEEFLSACGLLRDGGRWHGQLDAPVREVVMRTDGLRLGQLLKLAGVVDTGTEAKELLALGEVRVNGEVELRRGRQLTGGDLVIAPGHAVQVVAGT